MNDSEMVKLADETAMSCEGVSGVHRPARITRNGDSITIDTYLRVIYGEKIPTLAWNVQQKIKDAIQAECDGHIKAVNINIHGVDEKVTR